MKDTFEESLSRIKEDMLIKSELVEKPTGESEKNELLLAANGFADSINPVDTEFVSGTSSVSNHNTIDDSEIFSDTLKKMEHGSNESKDSIIKALLSFNDMNLPDFSKYKNTKSLFLTRASILFQGAFVNKSAISELNESYKFDINWKGGFLVGRNVKILAFRYWKYKNKKTYYSDKINSYLKYIKKTSGKNYILHLNSFQLLNGFACKPIFPYIEDINLSGSWNFIGR